MRYSIVAVAAFAAHAAAHGYPQEIKGANGVNMPALGMQDGTPLDCASPACGSEADTTIIRERELGTNKASALGRTQGGGPVDADKDIATFMGGAAARKRGLLDGLTGGGAAAQGTDAEGTKTQSGSVEQGVSRAAGTGATSGMPTAADDGTVTMTYHQVNQDGAGPLTAQVDSTSGGTDPAAFQDAEVTQNVPGLGIGGLSAASTEDFEVKAKMADGTVCEGTAGGASNVCIMRVQNSAAAGPFGGSVAFTQTAAQRKRAIAYRLKARGLHVARGTIGKAE